MDSLDGQLNQKHHAVCLFKLGHEPYSYYLHYLYDYLYNRKNFYIHAGQYEGFRANTVYR